MVFNAMTGGMWGTNLLGEYIIIKTKSQAFRNGSIAWTD